MRHMIAFLILISQIALTLPAFGDTLEQDLSYALSKLDLGIQQLESQNTQSTTTLNEASALLEAVITDHQIKASGIYHALGNAYMLNKNIGQAVLSYRRGELLDPTSRELRESLANARSFVPIHIGDGSQSRIWSILLLWRGHISRSTLWFVFLSLSTLGWIGFSTNILGYASPSIRSVSIWFILCSLIPLAMLGSEKIRYHNSIESVITSSDVAGRSGPDDAIYDPVFSDSLQPGVEARVLGSRNEWSQIELTDGSQCWVPTMSIELVNP